MPVKKSSLQILIILWVMIAAMTAVMLSFQHKQSVTGSVSGTRAIPNKTVDDTITHSAALQAHPLLALAQHHCSKLQPDAERDACINQIIIDLEAGEFAPSIPEVNPLACDSVSDPAKQHECHAWMGHDFAVSTGESGKCQVIPQDAIRASCVRQITINEIKTLYSLDLDTENTASESRQ